MYACKGWLWFALLLYDPSVINKNKSLDDTDSCFCHIDRSTQTQNSVTINNSVVNGLHLLILGQTSYSAVSHSIAKLNNIINFLL